MFTNLHLHTHYSIMDSVIKINDLIELLKEYKQDAVAITDHASISGWIDLDVECKKNNIKPIFGCEFYCTPSYSKNKSRDRQHLLILAKDETGLYNIRKLLRIANDNFYYKPIMSYDSLFENQEGLIISSACSLGVVAENLIKKNYAKAVQWASLFKERFGDDYYLELQMHPQFGEQSVANEGIVRLSEELDIKTIVTTDSHILKQEDTDLRNMIQAIGYHKSMNEVYQTLKSNCIGNEEIIKTFAEESGFIDFDILNKSFKNTQEITNKCNAQMENFGKVIPPFNKYDQMNKFFEVAQ